MKEMLLKNDHDQVLIYISSLWWISLKNSLTDLLTWLQSRPASPSANSTTFPTKISSPLFLYSRFFYCPLIPSANSQHSRLLISWFRIQAGRVWSAILSKLRQLSMIIINLWAVWLFLCFWKFAKSIKLMIYSKKFKR